MNVYVQYFAKKPGLSIRPSPKSAKNSRLTTKRFSKMPYTITQLKCTLTIQ